MIVEDNPEIQKKLKENDTKVYTYKGENELQRYRDPTSLTSIIVGI